MALERLAEIAETCGDPDLAFEFRDMSKRQKAKDYDVLEGVTVYDKSLELAIDEGRIYEHHGLKLNFHSGTRVVVRNGISNKLYPKESKCLELLLVNKGAPVTYPMFDQLLYNSNIDIDFRNALTNIIFKIRMVLEPGKSAKECKYLVNISNKGYILKDIDTEGNSSA